MSDFKFVWGVALRIQGILFTLKDLKNGEREEFIDISDSEYDFFINSACASFVYKDTYELNAGGYKATIDFLRLNKIKIPSFFLAFELSDT